MQRIPNIISIEEYLPKEYKIENYSEANEYISKNDIKDVLPMAVIVPHNNARIMAQNTLFAKIKPIDIQDSDENDIAVIREELNVFGYNRSKLMPELEYICEYIKNDNNTQNIGGDKS